MTVAAEKIMFVLPVSGGSGGANSVFQEADAILRFGVPVLIAANTGNVMGLRESYREFQALAGAIVGFDGPEGLAALARQHDVTTLVATTNQSVHTVVMARREHLADRDVRVAYYVQDYEPLFYPYGSAEWNGARASYGADPDLILFAKTHWLQEVVEANHGVTVHKVEASIDHGEFFPDFAVRADPTRPLTIAAMLRPSTPRRAPRRTARILSALAHEFEGKLRCVSFGCDWQDVFRHGLVLTGVDHRGRLTRAATARLLRGVDLFLDLSDYQAFGRTALEGMSCGAVPVVPIHGGAGEFAIDGDNAFLVDTRHDEAILAAVRGFIALPERERRAMALAAVDTGYRYTPERAALSELRLLSTGFAAA